MRLLAKDRTWSFVSESKLQIVLILLWAKLRSLRWTSLLSPLIFSMLLKERSSHSSWVSDSRDFSGISSMMLLSSWSLRRLVNCHKFSIRRISGKKRHYSIQDINHAAVILWKSSLRWVTSTKSMPSSFASRPASPSGPCSTMHWRSRASLMTFGSIVSYKWLIFVYKRHYDNRQVQRSWTGRNRPRIKFNNYAHVSTASNLLFALSI